MPPDDESDIVAALPDRAIPPGHPVGDAFRARGVLTFRDACRWVHALPYGRNPTTGSVLAPLADGCGTCVTKHGVIARLAEELSLDVYKHVGFYRLNDAIVTGVEALLAPYGLSFIPQMHCFLEHDGRRVDLTEGNRHGKNQTIDAFDFIVRVGPEPAPGEMDRLYASYLERYRAIDPRLAAIPTATISGLLKACGELLRSPCSLVAST